MREIRSSAPGVVVGIRLSIGEEGGLAPELLPHLDALADYVNLTVGVRTTYVRDMATEAPPLLGDIGQLRQLVDGPLLISHAFRTPDTIDAALAAGADLVGVARALIADPDMPRKLLGGRAADIRPCVACNEDCRAFDPVLLCSVNPELGPPGADRRPAAPLVVRRAAEPAGGRVAIVGAGPAGLECALALAGRREVVLFDAREAIGGQLAVAAAAPNRHGWRALLDFYSHAVEGVRAPPRLAGARGRPRRLRRGRARGRQHRAAAGPAGHRARAAVVGCDRPAPERAQPAGGGRRVRLVAVRERRRARRPAPASRRITVATPGAAFGGSLPPEGRVQLLARLRGAPLQVRPFTALDSLAEDSAVLRNTMSGTAESVPADTVIVVGERIARDWSALVPGSGTVRVIGDALVPRKASHAIAEGRAAAESIAGARLRTAAAVGA